MKSLFPVFKDVIHGSMQFSEATVTMRQADMLCSVVFTGSLYRQGTGLLRLNTGNSAENNTYYCYVS